MVTGLKSEDPVGRAAFKTAIWKTYWRHRVTGTEEQVGKKIWLQLFLCDEIDNDLKVAHPLYVSTIYIMLGFEWRNALSQRKPPGAMARTNKLNKVRPYIEHQLCDLHPGFEI